MKRERGGQKENNSVPDNPGYTVWTEYYDERTGKMRIKSVYFVFHDAAMVTANRATSRGGYSEIKRQGLDN